MRLFTKQETITVSLIFLVVFTVTFLNMQTSLRRARDAQRKGDLGDISNALEKFRNELGFFPLAENGKIKMCKASNFNEILEKVKSKEVFDTELFYQGLRGCEWGKDGLYDVLDDSVPAYMKTLPSDPKTPKGINYIYLGNSNRFQLYTYLEGENEESGYDNRIVDRQLKCGNKICSFGKAYSVPMERDINDYEKELLKKK